jgi:hypothetical protein
LYQGTISAEPSSARRGGGDPVEVADGEEQEVGRHGRRGLEGDELPAARLRFHPGLGHVADDVVGGGDDDAQIVGRAELRLVPAGKEAPRVGRLELGEQGALLALRAVIVEREQARGLGVDLARIIEAHPVAAGLDGSREPDGRRLLVGVGLDPLHRDFVRAVDRGEGRAADVEVGGIENDAVGRLRHLDVDRAHRTEDEVGRVGRRGDAVLQRPDVAGELGRHLPGRGRRGGRGGGGSRIVGAGAGG